MKEYKGSFVKSPSPRNKDSESQYQQKVGDYIRAKNDHLALLVKTRESTEKLKTPFMPEINKPKKEIKKKVNNSMYKS